MPNSIDDLPPIVPGTTSIETNATETHTGGGGVHHHSGSGVVTGAEGNPAPASGGVIPGDGVPRPGGLLGLADFTPGKALAMYDFDRTKAPGTVAFVDVLEALGRSPQGEAGVQKLLAYVKTAFGVTVPEAQVQAIMHRPELILQYLRMSPTDLRTALDGLHASGAASELGMAPRTFHIPTDQRNSFDWRNLDTLAVPMPEDDVKELAPGLYRGSLRNRELDDAGAKNNIVMAEVFERLADNANLPPDERFTFHYQANDGHTREITRLPELLEALRDDGWQVKAHTAQMVANFAHFMTKAGDQFMDVAAPVMVETPFEDADGAPAVVPAVHSELVISIERGATVPPGARDMTSQIKWYQGVPTTGFMAANLYKKPDWTGYDVKDRFQNDEALKVIEYAGLYSDMINDVAREKGLAVGGYGATGVCIDTVAILQRLMNRPITAYPMLHSDRLLIDEALRRHGTATEPGTGSRLDRPEYRAIIQALKDVDNDAAPVDPRRLPPDELAALKKRILDSIPWPPGMEPLTICRFTRSTLG